MTRGEGFAFDCGDSIRQGERDTLPTEKGFGAHLGDGVLHAVVRHLLRNDDGHAFGHVDKIVALVGGLHRRCAGHFVFNVVAAAAGGVIDCERVAHGGPYAESERAEHGKEEGVMFHWRLWIDRFLFVLKASSVLAILIIYV